MKIKTSELTGVALDWAVAKAEYGGLVVHYRTWLQTKNEYWKDHDCSFIDSSDWRVIAELPDGVTTQTIKKASTDWRIAGPIIEREKIEWKHHDVIVASIWYRDGIGSDEQRHKMIGKTILEASMRCYVASKLGCEIEVPDELA